jgi:hypothetical protein
MRELGKDLALFCCMVPTVSTIIIVAANLLV